MARPKSNNEIQSINFDREVLKALKEQCRRDGVNISTFVNKIIKTKVMSTYEYNRQRMKDCAAEMYKYKVLMETSPDAPPIK